MKTDEDLQVQNVSKSEKDQINKKSPKKSEKDRVKTKSLRSEEDIFRDTEKDLDEDAAYVSNVVTGDTLSDTAMRAGVHISECVWLRLQVQTFKEGWIRRERRSLRKGRKCL